MKKRSDPRHQKRIRLMRSLFSWQFRPKLKIPKDIEKVISILSEIDKLIASSAPTRPIKNINRVDLSILRLATFELIMEKGTPPKVVVDEAIELGKEFGSESSASFINGVLGKVIKIKKIQT